MAFFTSAPPLWTYPPFQLRKYSQTFSRTLQLKRLGLGTIGIRWRKSSFSSNILVCYSPLANDPAVSPDMRECVPDIVSQLTILRVPPSLWIENWAVNCKWSVLHVSICCNGFFLHTIAGYCVTNHSFQGSPMNSESSFNKLSDSQIFPPPLWIENPSNTN